MSKAVDIRYSRPVYRGLGGVSYCPYSGSLVVAGILVRELRYVRGMYQVDKYFLGSLGQ